MKAWTWLRHALRMWRRQERGQVIVLAAGAMALVPVFVERPIGARGFH